MANPLHYSGFDQTPFTVALHPLIPSQREHIDAKLKVLGVDETVIGGEFEFELVTRPGITVDEQKEADLNVGKLRQYIIRLLEKEPDQVKAQARLKEVREFNAAELLMYGLHELEPLLRGKLEPAFGIGRDDLSYYDAQEAPHKGMVELKIKPVPSEAFADTHYAFLYKLYEKAAKYGLQVVGPPEPHLNVSFRKDGKNLLDPNYPDYKTTSTRIITGIIHAANQGEAIAGPTMTPTSALTCSRDSNFRLAGEGEKGRLECRLPVISHTVFDLATYIECIIKPGAAYGLETNCTQEVTFTKRAGLTRNADNYKMLLHTMQSSTLREETPDHFRLVLPKDYFRSSAEKIADELGIVLATTYGPRRGESGVKVDELKQWMENIRIVKSGDSYALVLPETFQTQYQPPPVINTAALVSQIHCTGVVDSLEHPGLPATANKDLLLFEAPVYDKAHLYLTPLMRSGIDNELQKESLTYKCLRDEIKRGEMNTQPFP